MSKRSILHRYSCPFCTATAYPNESLEHDWDCPDADEYISDEEGSL